MRREERPAGWREASPRFWRARVVDWWPAVRRILAWTFTLCAMLVLLAGSLLTSAFVSAGYVGPAIGQYVWLVTIALIGVLGMLALLASGRPIQAVAWLLCSPVVSYAWFFIQLVLWLAEPTLMIPSVVALNGLYAYLAWRFLLSRPSILA